MTDMKVAMIDFAARQAERAARADTELQYLKKAVIPPLRATGIVTVEVHFEGSGDSGAVDGCTCFDAAGKETPCPEAMIDRMREEGEKDTQPVPQITLYSALEDLTYLALERHHPGWEINDGADGELVIDVAKTGFMLDCSLRYTAYDDHYTEL